MSDSGQYFKMIYKDSAELYYAEVYGPAREIIARIPSENSVGEFDAVYAQTIKDHPFAQYLGSVADEVGDPLK